MIYKSLSIFCKKYNFLQKTNKNAVKPLTNFNQELLYL